MKIEEYDPNQPEQTNTSTPPPQPEPDPAPVAPAQTTQEQSDIGYLPIDGLPSKGRFYPEGTTIKGRPLKVMEVKHLASMDEKNADDIVNDVLSKSIIGIDLKDVVVSDKLYMVFWLRANTYKDSGFGVEFKCNKCGEPSTYDFELDNLKIKEIPDNVNPGEDYKLPSGNVVTFKHLTVEDEKKNRDFLKNNRNSLMSFDEEMVNLVSVIDTIDGKKVSMVDKYMFVTEQITPIDFSHLQTKMYEITSGLEPSIDVKCKKCGGESETALPFRPDFFLPKVLPR